MTTENTTETKKTTAKTGTKGKPGRKPNSTTAKKSAAKAEPNVEKLVQESIAKAIAEMQKKFDEEKAQLQQELEKTKSSMVAEPVVAEKDIPKDRRTVRLPSDLRIEVRSNVGGKFVLAEPKGKNPFYYIIDGYGQSIEMTYEELRAYWGANHKYFDDGTLTLVDVIHDEYDLDDLIGVLRIDKLYKSGLPMQDLELLFDKECEYEEFTKLFSENKKVAGTILDVAVNMYKQGRLRDMSKANFLKQKFGLSSLFS